MHTPARPAREELINAIGATAAAQVEASWRPENLADVPLRPYERDDVEVSVAVLQLPSDDAIATAKASWDAAPRVTTLPERLVFVGLREGEHSDEVVFEKTGRVIPPTLDVGPDPSLPDDEQMKADGPELVINQSLRWLTEFDEAVAKGMAVVVDLEVHDYHRGFDRVVVLGARIGTDADEGAELLEELFRDHHRSRGGLALLPQGTPTNNTDDVDSGTPGLTIPTPVSSACLVPSTRFRSATTRGKNAMGSGWPSSLASTSRACATWLTQMAPTRRTHAR